MTLETGQWTALKNKKFKNKNGIGRLLSIQKGPGMFDNLDQGRAFRGVTLNNSNESKSSEFYTAAGKKMASLVLSYNYFSAEYYNNKSRAEK